MPNPPSTDGLPFYLQIAVTLLFGVLSVAVLWRSFKSADQPHQGTTIAHLTDMQPMRDLCVHIAAMTASIERLIVREQETEHHTRNQIEEMVRMRRSIDAMTRSLDRWRAD